MGADGMLGHEVAKCLADNHDVVGTVRRPPTAAASDALSGADVLAGIDVRSPDSWVAVLSDRKPDVVVNCTGIVKQRAAAADPIESIEVNSLFPHKLAAACGSSHARLIHISTDCVFSGERGNYTESDNPDPVDLYGRSKLLGELDGPPCVTIRTSLVGLELGSRSGLVEWFLSQEGDVRGYRKAIWSGLTAAELARVIARLMEQSPDFHGIWHVSSAPISKYELLKMLADLLGRRSAVIPDDSVVIDRSLNSSRFRASTGYAPPSHQTMLAELAAAVLVRKENRFARG
jgi:dTDP-4-dehydrorhamnose reductase